MQDQFLQKIDNPPMQITKNDPDKDLKKKKKKIEIAIANEYKYGRIAIFI